MRPRAGGGWPGRPSRALGIAEGRVNGAAAQLVKVLNLEGYPVLREDAGMVVLDPALLAEQFEVHA